MTVAADMIKNFGIGVVPPTPFLKKLEDLATHSNAQIRNAVIGFYVELYCWMRESVMALLSHLKPAQMVSKHTYIDRTGEEVRRD